VYIVSERPADPGWATGAGVYGIVAAVGTLGLTLGSELTKDEQIPSLPLGASATMLIAISGPITAVGAASARDGGGVRGNPGLRVVGWVGYGLSLLDATLLLGLGVNEVEPPDGVIMTVGALGATSLVCFAADAFSSASEAEEARAARPAGASLTVLPALSWARGRTGELEPVVGVVGAF